jgi:hypothetical protein
METESGTVSVSRKTLNKIKSILQDGANASDPEIYNAEWCANEEESFSPEAQVQTMGALFVEALEVFEALNHLLKPKNPDAKPNRIRPQTEF